MDFEQISLHNTVQYPVLYTVHTGTVVRVPCHFVILYSHSFIHSYSRGRVRACDVVVIVRAFALTPQDPDTRFGIATRSNPVLVIYEEHTAVGSLSFYSRGRVVVRAFALSPQDPDTRFSSESRGSHIDAQGPDPSEVFFGPPHRCRGDGGGPGPTSPTRSRAPRLRAAARRL